MKSTFSIRWKFLLTSYTILILSVLLLTLFISQSFKTNAKNEITHFKTDELNKKKQALKDYVDIAYTNIITAYKGETQKQADASNNNAPSMESALKTIQEMRYDDGKGYFWINDTATPYPTMVMHPTVPALNGQVLDDPKYNCALGKKENLFKAFVQTTSTDGEGFVDYRWPKPGKNGSLTPDQPKLSYVKRVPQLNWILGTGIYIDDIDTKVQAKQEELNAQLTQLIKNIWTITVAISLAAFLGLWLTARKITNPINECALFAGQMGEGNLDASLTISTRDETGVLGRILLQMGNTIKTVITRVMTISATLSDGATQQASSIEETSASLEEMSAMTKQNAANASQAVTLIKQTLETLGYTNQVMTKLTHSMKEISVASQEIQKIIGTIDEIAFQTNLLALNAAVEAARAGDAGAGFAVVADEVRSLAQRSAEAAKNTAALIETTVARVHDGSDITRETESKFAEVSGHISNAETLITEISQGSHEQSLGIEQLNIAMAQINAVTQQNVSNAEELLLTLNSFIATSSARTAEQKTLLPSS